MFEWSPRGNLIAAAGNKVRKWTIRSSGLVTVGMAVPIGIPSDGDVPAAVL